MWLTGGIDEVGRGALAGPIMAAVAVFDHDLYVRGCPNPDVRDSKQFSSEEARVKVFDQLMRADWLLDFGVGSVSPQEIDLKGINWANQEVFHRAVMQLRPDCHPNTLVVDGHLPVPGWGGQQTCVPKADRDFWSVSAASIIAKVVRDRLMNEYHLQFPQYHWLNNKGYGTREHTSALRHRGPCRLHRQRFLGKVLSKGPGDWAL
jgi:ribonuclease HII